MNLKGRLKENAELVEKALAEFFRDKKDTTLYKAMQYSINCGGKRIRPFLVIEFCRMLGGDVKAALPYAAAIEMIHTFSLIHDDLPCMDNDDLRRGKPTNHKVFGEAQALLAGDAMIFSAIECALSNSTLSSENKLKAIKTLVIASGAEGMCEGQMLDIDGESRILTFDELLTLHANKTGALLRASSKLGVIAAGGDDCAIEAADTYGAKIGLAFQIIDDYLDMYGDSQELGKPCGSDQKNEKTTFLSFMDAADALEYAKNVTKEACLAIKDYDCSVLVELAEYLLQRKN
ncbi:MAG: polyprenyl synthetase family protein [Clostridia bacterium]|nr:polyprenyl synthetase family protein [Clostridia bacterium]